MPIKPLTWYCVFHRHESSATALLQACPRLCRCLVAVVAAGEPHAVGMSVVAAATAPASPDAPPSPPSATRFSGRTAAYGVVTQAAWVLCSLASHESLAEQVAASGAARVLCTCLYGCFSGVEAAGMEHELLATHALWSLVHMARVCAAQCVDEGIIGVLKPVLAHCMEPAGHKASAGTAVDADAVRGSEDDSKVALEGAVTAQPMSGADGGGGGVHVEGADRGSATDGSNVAGDLRASGAVLDAFLWLLRAIAEVEELHTGGWLVVLSPHHQPVM